MVALVFFLLLGFGFAMAVLVYQRYVAYEPSVSRHVPASATFAARFDLTHVMLYEPFRRAVFPLVDRGALGTPTRRDRLAERGLVVGADVRELLVALGPSGREWVIALGGRLPKSGAATILAEVLRAEGRTVEEGGAGHYSLTDPRLVFAQSDAGALLFASDEAWLRAALVGGPADPELDEGSGGLVASPEAWLPGLQRVKAHFRAGSDVALDARLEFGKGSAAAAMTQFLLPLLGRLDPLLEGPVRAAKVTSTADSTELQLLLPRETVERLIAIGADRFPF